MFIDARKAPAHSPNNFEPPMHIVSKITDKRIQTLDYKPYTFVDYLNDRQKPVVENAKRNLDEITEIATKFKKYCYDNWKMDEELCGPAAKILVMSIKWLHGVGSFVHMKPTEQTNLLRTNWKELFILTAAEYSFYFDDGKA